MSVNDYDEVEYELIARAMISLDEASVAYGIAAYAAGRGYEALSQKQKFIFDRDVSPLMMRITDQDAISARIYNAGD
jgi:hypothetical protein